jgi:endonuclease G
MKVFVYIFSFLFFSFVSQAQSLEEIIDLEIPKTKSQHQIVRHLGYTLQYNEKHEQADWVAYVLTKEETLGGYSRTNDFSPDFKVTSSSANDADYSGSGYDRGHLAPAADMGWSEQSMRESFFYSNMSPQAPSFNRGIWSRAEAFTRNAAYENEKLCVITGPVLEDDLPQIGPNKVSIPRYYYKVLLDFVEPDYKAIAFIIPNQAGAYELSHYAVSVDSVESITGIHFFSTLPDPLEQKLESEFNVADWPFGKEKKYNASEAKKQSGTSNALQCIGITKKGVRCKNKAAQGKFACRFHQ